MDKKKYLIEKIRKFENKYFNEDQKKMAISILENAPEQEVQAYADFIFMKRRTGFGFDYSPEIAKGRLVTLKEDIKKRINVNDNINDDENKLIIGDNYNALKALLITHKEKIDVIYIDPPYNTESAKTDGNRSSKEGESAKFIYKDKFGRGGWLNMMKARLTLASDLLSPDGVIFVSIDDSEQAYLKILMDEIFGEDNTLAAIVVQKKSGGGQSKSYYKGHDHLFVYAKNANRKKEFFVAHENPQFRKIEIKGKMFGYYPDSIRKMHGKFDRSKLKDGEIDHRNVFLEDYKITFDINKQKEIEKKLKSGEYITVPFEKLGTNMIVKAEPWENIESKKLAYSIITSWTTEGQSEFDDILMSKRGDDNWFEAPKPVSLIKYILEYNLPKSGIVLDFFAGSGTTGQATMELNREDNGNRKFILCTNDENEIAQKITYERLYRTIKGKTSDGKKDFNWIKNNKPYSNEKLRVIKIEDETKISLDQDINPSLYKEAKNGLILLDSKYNKENLNLYYDLAALNPLENDDDKMKGN